MELQTLRRRGAAISSLTPRWVANRPMRVPWLVYTDAATHPPKICALLFAGTADQTSLRGQWTDDVSSEWSFLFRRTALIFGLELLALVAFVDSAAPQLGGSASGST